MSFHTLFVCLSEAMYVPVHMYVHTRTYVHMCVYTTYVQMYTYMIMCSMYTAIVRACTVCTYFICCNGMCLLLYTCVYHAHHVSKVAVHVFHECLPCMYCVYTCCNGMCVRMYICIS